MLPSSGDCRHTATLEMLSTLCCRINWSVGCGTLCYRGGYYQRKTSPFNAHDICEDHEVAARDTLSLQTNCVESVRVKTEMSESGSIDKMQGLPVTIETCFNCGRSHRSKDCPFKNAVCFSCGKWGHLAKVCPSKLWNRSKHTNVTDGAENLSESTHMLFHLTSCRVPPIALSVVVNGQQVPMELDKGASVSLITTGCGRRWRHHIQFCGCQLSSSVPIQERSSVFLEKSQWV